MNNTFETLCSQNNIKVWNSEDITLGEFLGSGSFGTVYKATIAGSDKVYAIKFIKDFNESELSKDEIVESLFNELKGMIKLDIENVPKFYGFCNMNNINVKDSIESYGLIFTYIDGITLDKYLLEDFKSITDEEKLNIMIALTSIIAEIHKKGVIHRDLKPSNIMRRNDGSIVILDFGISKISEHTRTKTVNVKGTPKYQAPETIQEGDDELYEVSFKTDIWSIGAIMTELYSGVSPWSEKYKDPNYIMMALNQNATFKNDVDSDLAFCYPKNFENDQPDIYTIAKACLVRDYKSRLSAADLLSNLKELKENLNNCEDIF